jgi:hypothetical protein
MRKLRDNPSHHGIQPAKEPLLMPVVARFRTRLCMLLSEGPAVSVISITR